MAAPLYRNVHLADGGILSVAALDLQPQQVLSTAMPTPAQVGMLAYATDTFQLLQYQSATTGWTPPWNTPWGYVTSATLTSPNQTGIAALIDVAGLTVTATAVANRRWRVALESMFSLSQLTSAATAAAMTIATGASGAGTQLAQSQMSIPVNSQGVPGALAAFVTTTAGSLSYHVRCSTSAGTVTINTGATSPWALVVTDLGPAANPA